MAALRAEAVQARRLATRITNLHQTARVQKKGRIMNTTIADPGQAQRMSRRTTDKPASSGGQLNFNPLHPSMELPPEQLIRLLGLEKKTKRRKKRPTPVTARVEEDTSACSAPADRPVKLTRPKTPPASAERERDIASAPFGEPRRNLLVISLIVGAIAGTGLSAYLFWSGPDDDVATAVTHSVPAPKTGNPSPPATTVRHKELPDAAATTIAAPVEANRQGVVQRSNAISSGAIEVEEGRLRKEAEKRFAERRLQQDIRRGPETLAADVVLPDEVEPATHLATPAAPTEMLAPETDNITPAEDNTYREPAVTEMLPVPATVMPANETIPAETVVETDVSAEPGMTMEPEYAPVGPAEADTVQDNVTRETGGEALF
jgi:hypothetical protein